MASHEIVPLKCPSCGSSNTGPSKPLAFGAEFSCANCGNTSVLIVNRALLPVDALEKSGDQVCAVCGRVARRDARFCQGGHKLVRTCVSPDCGAEFAAHHQRCDHCGWPQDVKRGTPEAYELMLDIAIAELPDPDLFISALSKIHHVWNVSGHGKRAVASIVSLLRASESNKFPWYVLARMGASEVVPLLRQRISELPINLQWEYWRMMAMIAPQQVLPHCREVIAEKGKNPKDPHSLGLDPFWCAVHTTKFVGISAVPMLLDFCGWRSGLRGEGCQSAVNEINAKGRMIYGGYDDGSLVETWIRTGD